MASTSDTGLSRAFGKGHPALVAYLMGGYPTRQASLDALRVAAESGADLIELGVPYADPLADGRVIRDAAETARAQNEGGFGLAETIALAAEFIATTPDAPPVALMTYLNPMMRMGLPKVAAAMRDAGVSGVIVPDLPVEMAKPWLAASSGIDTVFLVAPTSTPERLKTVGELSSGFLYCVSTMGITGERSELPAELAELVASAKAATELPVAVGFGISTPEQAAAVARLAEGVIVGSAIVKRQHDLSELSTYVLEIATSIHSAV